MSTSRLVRHLGSIALATACVWSAEGGTIVPGWDAQGKPLDPAQVASGPSPAVQKVKQYGVPLGDTSLQAIGQAIRPVGDGSWILASEVTIYDIMRPEYEQSLFEEGFFRLSLPDKRMILVSVQRVYLRRAAIEVVDPRLSAMLAQPPSRLPNLVSTSGNSGNMPYSCGVGLVGGQHRIFAGVRSTGKSVDVTPDDVNYVAKELGIDRAVRILRTEAAADPLAVLFSAAKP